jgi:hypothetical protein
MQLRVFINNNNDNNNNNITINMQLRFCRRSGRGHPLFAAADWLARTSVLGVPLLPNTNSLFIPSFLHFFTLCRCRGRGHALFAAADRLARASLRRRADGDGGRGMFVTVTM